MHVAPSHLCIINYVKNHLVSPFHHSYLKRGKNSGKTHTACYDSLTATPEKGIQWIHW